MRAPEQPQLRSVDLLTLKQAGQSLGVTPDTLRAQIRRRKLAAIKLGRDWLVASSEVERYRKVSKRTPSPE